MFDVVLVHPEIPPNTGAVMRLCANTGGRLHLVEPLGFTMTDARLRRAGLDYRDQTTVAVHPSWDALRGALSGRRCWGFTTTAPRWFGDVTFARGDVLVFGQESTGLPPGIIAELGEDACARIPMVADSRSLNLSNSVAIAVYEGWRQLGYPAGV